MSNHIKYPTQTMTSVLRESMASEKKRQENVKKEEEQKKMAKDRHSRSGNICRSSYTSNFTTTTSKSNLDRYSKHSMCVSFEGDKPYSADKLRSSYNLYSGDSSGHRNYEYNISTVKVNRGTTRPSYDSKKYEDHALTRFKYNSKSIPETGIHMQREDYLLDKYEPYGGQKKEPGYSAASSTSRSHIPGSFRSTPLDADTNSSHRFMPTVPKNEVKTEKSDETVRNIGDPVTDDLRNANVKENKDKKSTHGDGAAEKPEDDDDDFPRPKEKEKKDKPLFQRRCKEENDVTQDKNLRFYRNEIKSKDWFGHTIEEMLKWKGNYQELESNHQYIQWLFPNYDSSGVNINAQPLQPHEVVAITEDPRLKDRFLRAYEMMLDFYGMKLVSRKTGEVEKSSNWKSRFEHLNRSTHNHLRISRIMNALASFGFGHFLMPLLSFLMSEEKHLPNLQNRTMSHWLNRALDASGFHVSDEGTDVDGGVAGGVSYAGGAGKETGWENIKGDDKDLEKPEVVQKVDDDKGDVDGDGVEIKLKTGTSAIRDDENMPLERDESGATKRISQISLGDNAKESYEMKRLDKNNTDENAVGRGEENEGGVNQHLQDNGHLSVCHAEVKIDKKTDTSAGTAADRAGAGSYRTAELEHAQRESGSGYDRIQGGTHFVGCNAKDI